MVAHVIIAQQALLALPALHSCALSVIVLWGDPWQPRLVCDLLSDAVDHVQLLNAAGVLTQCPPFATGTRCPVWQGDAQIPEDVGSVAADGVSFHVVVELVQAPLPQLHEHALK